MKHLKLFTNGIQEIGGKNRSELCLMVIDHNQTQLNDLDIFDAERNYIN